MIHLTCCFRCLLQESKRYYILSKMTSCLTCDVSDACLQPPVSGRCLASTDPTRIFVTRTPSTRLSAVQLLRLPWQRKPVLHSATLRICGVGRLVSLFCQWRSVGGGDKYSTWVGSCQFTDFKSSLSEENCLKL